MARLTNTRLNLSLGLAALLTTLAGCGSSKSRLATDQLLMSDAVDRTVSQMDFSVLAQKKVYFDTKYVQPIKGYVFVNAEYVISSLRQQLTAAGCLLQDKPEEAEFIVEARVGALGTDSHEVTYGIPANQVFSEAASVIPSTPRVPMVPEIALAKKNDSRGAAKIAVFAYHRETKQPVWQSGVAVATSTAKETWVFGAGPIRYGTIYDNGLVKGKSPRTQLAYSRDHLPEGRMASYYEEADFRSQHKRSVAAVARKPAAGDGHLRELPDVTEGAAAGGANASATNPARGSAAKPAASSSPAALPRSGPTPTAAPRPLPTPPDAYPFLPAQPQVLPHQLPLTSDCFPAPPGQAMAPLDPPQFTTDRLPGPPSQALIPVESLQPTSESYPPPGPQTQAPTPTPPVPGYLPFILQ
jgi:hypothetical protein